MNTKHFAISKESTDRITFGMHWLNENGLMSPILWCKEGEFRLIPKEVIANLLDLADIFAKSSSVCVHPELQIMWSQGIPISNLAGRALIGE